MMPGSTSGAVAIPAVSSSRAPASNRNEDAREEGTVWFTAARAGLVALLCAAPLAFGAVQVWAWSLLAVMSVGLLFCWAMGCVQQRVVTIRWFSLYVPAVLFLLLCVMQLLSGLTLDKIGTRETLIKLITDLVLLFLAGQVFATASRKFWNGFGLTVTVYAFALSVFAIVQFFSMPDLLYWTIKPQWGGAVFGPYVNHNHYAGLMEMLIPIGGVYLLGQTGRHPVRWLGAFAVLAAFASVELSGSRGGFISLVIEAVVFGIVFGRSLLLGRRRVAAIAATRRSRTWRNRPKTMPKIKISMSREITPPREPESSTEANVTSTAKTPSQRTG